MIGRGALLAAVALAALSGCGPTFDHLEFRERTTPPLTVSLLANEVVIPEGIAVAFEPIPMTQTDAIEDANLDLLSSNEAVLGLDRTIDGAYVIYGASVGVAQVNVFLDGEQVGVVPAKVTPQ